MILGERRNSPSTSAAQQQPAGRARRTLLHRESSRRPLVMPMARMGMWSMKRSESDYAGRAAGYYV